MDTLENKETIEVTAVEQPTTETVETKENEATEAAEVIAPTEAVAAADEPTDRLSQLQQIAADFAALLDQPIEQIKEKAEQLKNQFYKLQNASHEKNNAPVNVAVAEEAEAQIAETGEEEKEAEADVEATVVNEPTPQQKIGQEFRQLLNTYKEKKAEAHKQYEAELQQNQLRKENIIAQMKQMAEQDTADVQDNLKKFKDLQAEWKTIGAVPPEVATSLWKQYNQYQEQFYDLVKINYELRDYDFKKNLELKNQLIAMAEELKNKENVVEAFRSLQQLHDEWANIGPVAREVREDVWNRFKEASTVINKRHQEHFEQLHQKEEENLQLKLAIIDKLRTIDTDELTTSKQWDEATEQVNELQKEWRAVGFAPKKHNQLIYEEFRSLCDEFFAKKTAFYRQLKDVLGGNLQKKRSLVEKAEALQDSTEWKEATDQLVKLQQEWKQVGPVARKYSEDLWKRFQSACDTFFERKKAELGDQRNEERQNLDKKKAVIEKIENIATEERDKALAELRQLTAEYNAIGHVPFREKDKLYKQYRAAADKIFDQLNIKASERRLEAYAQEVEQKDENALISERRKLVRAYENLQQEIKTAENNILFFTSKSGKGNQLVDDMQKKIADLKRQLADLEKKINMIDNKI